MEHCRAGKIEIGLVQTFQFIDVVSKVQKGGNLLPATSQDQFCQVECLQSCTHDSVSVTVGHGLQWHIKPSLYPGVVTQVWLKFNTSQMYWPFSAAPLTCVFLLSTNKNTMKYIIALISHIADKDIQWSQLTYLRSKVGQFGGVLNSAAKLVSVFIHCSKSSIRSR